MLSLTKCNKILNKNGIYHTDDEIIKLREVLYKLAEIIHTSISQREMKQ